MTGIVTPYLDRTCFHRFTFECDSDCVKFLKDNGLKYADAGETHMLSDIVAWANQRNNEPEGVVEINLADIIKTELETKLL